MNVGAEDKAEDEGLAGIAAMLIALAALAERASGSSCLVRRLVLLILLPAEAVARNFLAEALTPQEPQYELFSIRTDGGSTDAVRLAVRLRALAAAFGDLRLRTWSRMRHICRMPGERACAQIPGIGRFTRGVMSPAEAGSMAFDGWWPKPHDTS